MREVAREGESPLQVMLRLMRDETEKIEVRLDAAKAAAPYMHRKMPVAVDEPTVVEPNELPELQQLSVSERKALLVLLEKALTASE